MFVVSLLAVATLLLLGACSLYHHEFKEAPDVPAGVELNVIQADDFGTLWSVPRAQKILDEVESLAQHESIYVVLFIHGWHHNADKGDSNLTDFSKKLAVINERLNNPKFASMRTELSGAPRVRVIGIYVGWRGRSLPGALDYLTLWWRKTAAERVGDGDVREFILRLQRIYLRANSIRKLKASEARVPRPYMGLVTMGHSLGGQVLLRAVAEGVETDLAYRAAHVADVVNSDSGTPSVVVREPVDSFGDVNILINPATEAYQFARIDKLSRLLIYPKCQLPQLLVFSADNDRPRQAFFPISRGLTRPFRPGFRPETEQGSLWGRALGEYVPQRSHVLIRESGTSTASLIDSDYDSEAGRRKIRDWDFSGATSFGGVAFRPDEKAMRLPNGPVAVAYTHDRLIDGHTGFFQPEFWGFLIDYVSFMEGKRLLWRQQWLRTGSFECPP